MSEARAITNLIGNAVAAVFIARWDGALDLARARNILAGREEPADVTTLAETHPAAASIEQ
jgi:Na+/H+-dicarboxylate symporter